MRPLLSMWQAAPGGAVSLGLSCESWEETPMSATSRQHPWQAVGS